MAVSFFLFQAGLSNLRGYQAITELGGRPHNQLGGRPYIN